MGGAGGAGGNNSNTGLTNSLLLVAQGALGPVDRVATQVARGTLILVRRVTQNIWEQMVSAGNAGTGATAGGSGNSELPETKGLLATLVMLVLTGMLVSIQPSVIL